MNYYKPRQRESLKWDYTCMNDGRVWAVGYCAGNYDHTPDEAPYHDDGHDTVEEACECYKRYQLDNHLDLDGQMQGQKRKCAVEGCEEWTQGIVTIEGWQRFVLCDEHRTRETVEKLYSVGETWSS